MNLAFTDINNAFVNMVQQNNPKKIISGLKNGDGEKSQFIEKLITVMEKIDNLEKPSNFFTGHFTAIDQKIDPVQNDFEKIINFLSEKLNSKKGTGFVAALQNIFLMLSDHDLKNVSIDADGLEALKKMLVKAGFKENDINDLISELLEDQENNSIPVKDLLDKLFELDFEPQPLAEEKPKNYLEISALPFLESLMNSLNIELDKVKEILTKADKGEKGLDLDLIINKLQELQKESFYTGNQYKTGEYKTGENDNNFTMLLKQIDLEKKHPEASSLNLADFVDSLENLRKKILHQNKILHQDVVPSLAFNDQKNTASEKNTDPFNALFRNKKLSQPIETIIPYKKLSQPIETIIPYKKLSQPIETIIPYKKLSQPIETIIPLEIKDQKNISLEKNLDILHTLFKGLKFENKKSKAQSIEFSERQIKNQIKNQFKNQLLIPDPEKTNESKLFVLGKTVRQNSNKQNTIAQNSIKQKTDTLIKHGLKEIEPMLDGKKNTILDTKNQTKPEWAKSEGAKILDQTQISSLDTKASDTQSNLHNLKTKTSFKNLPNYVTQQVSKSLVRAINQGESTLRIQLKPPELGRLMIIINNSGNNIKVNIVTENHAAREMLASNVNELRATLSNSGVNLERFDVDMNSNFRQSMADAKNQSGQFSGQFSRRNKNKDNDFSDQAEGGNINESISVFDILKQNGSLHFVA